MPQEQPFPENFPEWVRTVADRSGAEEAGVEPTEDAWRPPTGLKPARPTGSGTLPNLDVIGVFAAVNDPSVRDFGCRRRIAATRSPQSARAGRALQRSGGRRQRDRGAAAGRALQPTTGRDPPRAEGRRSVQTREFAGSTAPGETRRIRPFPHRIRLLRGHRAYSCSPSRPRLVARFYRIGAGRRARYDAPRRTASEVCR